MRNLGWLIVGLWGFVRPWISIDKRMVPNNILIKTSCNNAIDFSKRHTLGCNNTKSRINSNILIIISKSLCSSHNNINNRTIRIDYQITKRQNTTSFLIINNLSFRTTTKYNLSLWLLLLILVTMLRINPTWQNHKTTNPKQTQNAIMKVASTLSRTRMVVKLRWGLLPMVQTLLRTKKPCTSSEIIFRLF